MPLRNSAKYLGGLALAVVLLGWVLRGTDPQAVREHLQQVPIRGLVWGLTLAAALNLGHNVFRVWRWRALLEPVRPAIPFRPMFDAVILGYMTTWLVPGRLGELVRPALLSGREGVPLGPCLGSVFADRVLDGLAVLVLFAGGVAFTPLAGEAAAHATTIRNASLIFVLAIILPLVLLLAARTFRQSFERWLAGRRGAVAWVSRFMLAFAGGTEALRRPALLVRALAHTALAWLAISAATWIGIRASGAEIPPGGVFVLLPLLVLGIALPTPGGAGGYHLAMKIGLMNLFGVPEPAAVAAGFLMHLVVVVPVILLGVALLLVDRIPLRELIEAAKQVRTLGHADPNVAAPRPMERSP